MSSVIVAGDVSGSVTLQAPSAAGSTVITLPATSGTMLTTASSGQSIPKAALPTGSVLQVVQGTYATLVTNSTTTYADTGITATITPTSATSKILVQIMTNYRTRRAGAYAYGYLNMVRNSTQLLEHFNDVYTNNATDCNIVQTQNFTYLDSPATTSATTYKMQLKAGSAGSTMETTYDGNLSTIVLMEIAA